MDFLYVSVTVLVKSSLAQGQKKEQPIGIEISKEVNILTANHVLFTNFRLTLVYISGIR